MTDTDTHSHPPVSCTAVSGALPFIFYGNFPPSSDCICYIVSSWEYSMDVSRQLHSLTALTHSCCCDIGCHDVFPGSAVREFSHFARNNLSTESRGRLKAFVIFISAFSLFKCEWRHWRWEPHEKSILALLICDWGMVTEICWSLEKTEAQIIQAGL